MPIVEPQAKHKYIATIAIEVDHPDPVRAFQVATELVRRITWGAPGQECDGVPFRGPIILQAEVERIDPEKGGQS